MKRLSAYFVLVLFAVAGCEEPFPTYQEPRDVLEASLQKTSRDSVLIVIDSTGVVLGIDPGKFRVYVKNKYQQLLEGEALINGRVSFFSFVPVPRVAVSSLARGNLYVPPIFQNRIAIPPGDSARLDVSWSYLTPSGYLYTGLPYEESYSGTTRIRTYTPVSVTAEAEVQVFERVQAIRTTQISFTLVFIELKLNAHP